MYRFFLFNLNTERMKFLEKDLEEIIYSTDRELLKNKGLVLDGCLKRQLRIGNYGIADLVTFKRYLNVNHYFSHFSDIGEPILDCETNPVLDITVYELKKDNISLSAMMQAVRYVKGIKQFLDKREFSFDVNFNIVVIGRQIPLNDSFCYVPDIFENVDFYTYSYDVDGINFNKHENYYLTNQGF